MDRVFTAVDDHALAGLVASARRKLVFVAPGLRKSVALAIAKALADFESLHVTVILDIDSEVCRLGYGDIEGLEIVKKACEARRSLLLHQPGIRIGLIIADETTLVFSPTPLLIEAGSHQPDKPNAILLQSAAAANIEAACSPSDPEEHPEIGLDPARAPAIQDVKNDLEVNPPQKFDVSRAVRIFNSRIQYVDFSFSGYRLSKKEVSIPPSLLGLANNRELVERWKNAFRVFGASSGFVWEHEFKDDDGDDQKETVTETSLEEEKKQIIGDFLIVLPNYGTVIQRSQRKAFDQRIADFTAKVASFQTAVGDHLEGELKKSRNNLAQELAKRLMPNLPPHLKKVLPDKPTLKNVADLIEDELESVFGDVEDVFTPKVETQFKEVAYETLQDPKFIELLRRAFRKNFASLFSEYDAAPATGQLGLKAKPSKTS